MSCKTNKQNKQTNKQTKHEVFPKKDLSQFVVQNEMSCQYSETN